MRYISELINKKRKVSEYKNSVVLKYDKDTASSVPLFSSQNGGARVNILALGDVGGTLLMGLRLLGEEVIESIGIYDLNPSLLRRYEREINQICYPDNRRLPDVEITDEKHLFDCDMFVFCASKGVPPIGASGDVRMAQLKANCDLVSLYAKKAAADGFGGIFAVVSDPVDLLCKAALAEGLKFEQVQGYGLGVMNARALYIARKEEKYDMYEAEGRAFGPHGDDLVIANSIVNYDDDISRELTEAAVTSNMKTREDGFKPYIAPALSSGSISLIKTLRGEWNYSSVYLGYAGDGAFLGCRNRRVKGGIEIENPPLDTKLFERIRTAYDNLCKVNKDA